MKRIFALLAGFAWVSQLLANDGYRRDDAFEYHNLANLKVSSIWTSTLPTSFDPFNLFGAENSTQEGNNGHYAFTDSDLPTNDWAEWETLQAVPLTGYSVYLLEDVGRVASLVRFQVDTNGSGNYVTVDEFVPSYTTPHLTQARPGLAAETTRTLAQPVFAKHFRIELQRENVRFMYGIRVIEIDAISTPNPEPPSVEFVKPGFSDQFLEGDSIPVEIAASDPQQIDRVELYANNELIGKSATSKNFTVTNVALGSLVLMAKAVDKLGGESQTTMSLTIGEKIPSINLRSARAGEGYFYFDVEGGRPGSNQVVWWSVDFQQWTAIKTNAYPGEAWTFAVPVESAGGFFKVEHLPIP